MPSTRAAARAMRCHHPQLRSAPPHPRPCTCTTPPQRHTTLRMRAPPPLRPPVPPGTTAARCAAARRSPRALPAAPRLHGKALLVTFDSGSDVQAATDAITMEIQSSFKKLDTEIRGMATGPGAQEDPEVLRQVQRQLAQVGAGGRWQGGGQVGGRVGWGAGGAGDGKGWEGAREGRGRVRHRYA